MKSKTFEYRIKPVMDVLLNLCEEEGIEFLAQFNFDEDGLQHYQSNNMLLDGATIMSQYQKWELRHNK